MKIRITIYKSDKITKEGFPIKVICEHKGKKKRKNTGFYAFEDQWDKRADLPLPNHPQYQALYELALEWKRSIVEVIVNGWEGFDRIFDHLLKKPREKEIDFFLFGQKRAEELKKTGKISNARHYEMVLRMFREFHGPAELPFARLDRSLMNEFKISKISEGLKNNSVHNYLRTLAAIYNEAVIRGFTADLRPFSRIMPKLEKTQDKFIELEEMRMIFKTEILKGRGEISGLFDFRNYFLLQFLLSGIDLVDLANLRYDKHSIRGRLKFQRFKGGTSEYIDNIICDEAKKILSYYKEKSHPYFLPIFKGRNYPTFSGNYIRRFREWCKQIGVENYVSTKTPRYTFIRLGRLLGVEERVMSDLVGHSRQSTHAIYDGKATHEEKDAALLKIDTIPQSV